MIKIIERTIDHAGKPSGVRELPEQFPTRMDAERFLNRFLGRAFIDPRYDKGYDGGRDQWRVQDNRVGTRFWFEIVEAPSPEPRQ